MVGNMVAPLYLSQNVNLFFLYYLFSCNSIKNLINKLSMVFGIIYAPRKRNFSDEIKGYRFSKPLLINLNKHMELSFNLLAQALVMEHRSAK